jgi:putative transposase
VTRGAHPVALTPSATAAPSHQGPVCPCARATFGGERRGQARPSIGTVADSYDNALAETTNGLYKTECVFGPDAPRRWEDVDKLELATLSWVHWFNEDRLHGHCRDVPPAEFEAAFYAAQQADPAGVGIQ